MHRSEEGMSDDATYCEGCVIVLLDSCLDVNDMSTKLKQKFLSQQQNKKKWLENREMKYRHFIPIEFMKDKYYVLKAVKQDGFALDFAANEFNSDKEVVLEAVKQNGFALQYSDELYNVRMNAEYSDVHL